MTDMPEGRGFIDETGNTHGYRDVISYGGKTSNNVHYWLCRCVCGDESLVSGGQLRKGRSSSCGCMAAGITSKKLLIDETGNTYNRLTVLERADEVGGDVLWNCLCSCGEAVVVRAVNLRNGNTTSCGCERLKSLARELIEGLPLKVAKVEGSTPYKVVDSSSGKAADRWEFLCQDHGVFSAKYCHVVVGHTKCPSCSCGGFKDNAPSSLYILSVTKGEDNICHKVGITSKDVTHRVREIDAKTSFDVSLLTSFTFDMGIEARKVESIIKKMYCKPLLSKEEFQCGHTELFPSKDLLNTLKLINTYKDTI